MARAKAARRAKQVSKLGVTGGWIRSIVFDPQLEIRRRFEWAGPFAFDIDNNQRRGDIDLDKPIELGTWPVPSAPDGDRDLLGGGPIELTPGGPRQPSPPVRPPDPPPAPVPVPPIKLDPWQHLPPVSPWPWDKPFDLPQPDPETEEDWLSLRDPCEAWNLFGPLGPFSWDGHIDLLFPRVPWMGPWQKPVEDALAKALREFVKELGDASNQGTIHGKDWESAGKKAGAAAGKVLWEYLWDRLQRRWFGGKLDIKSFCDFAEDRPWLTGLGIFVGLTGYGLYLGDEYRRRGRLKIDFGDVEFEYDGKTGEWSFGVKFRFKF